MILDKKAQVDLIREVADELGFSLKDFTAKEYADKICEEKQDRAYIPLMLDTGRRPCKENQSHGGPVLSGVLFLSEKTAR